MRMSFRLIVSLVLAIALVSLLFAVYQVETENLSKRNELERRAEILAESLQETVEALREEGSQEKLHQIIEKFGSRERLAGRKLSGRRDRRGQRRPICSGAAGPRSRAGAPVRMLHGGLASFSGFPACFMRMPSTGRRPQLPPLRRQPPARTSGPIAGRESFRC
jgi:hypothetical protein